MATEKNQKTNRRKHPGDPEARGLKFKIRTDDSAEQKERGKRGDPLRDMLEPRRLEAHDATGIQPAKPGQLRHIGCDTAGEQGLSADHPRGLLRAQREKRTLGVDDLAIDFHFLVEVHEAIHQLGVVAVFLRHAAEVSGEIGNDFGVHRLGDFLTRTRDRRGCSDGTDRRHEDFFCGERDERPCRTRVGIHIGVGGHRAFGEHLDDFLGGLQVAAGGVHIEHDRRRTG